MEEDKEDLPIRTNTTVISEICLICYEPRIPSDFLSLECSHTFCKICLFRDWQSKIKSGYLDISFLKCPQENCRNPISLLHLKSLLPPEFYSKVEELCNINSQVLNPTLDKSIRCPHCDIRFDIWKDADYFTCPQCKICYCAKCSAEYEKHKDFTCEEYEENKDKTVEEQAFYKEMRSKGYRKCPGCFCFVERAEGCNYIKCQSGKCLGKVSFCYLCGDKLDPKEHYSHYVMSPWEGPCIKIAFQKKKEPDEEKPEKEKDKLNDFVICPGCEKLCKIQRGLDQNGRFCVCESKECKGKTYCLLCKKEANDRKFPDHLSGDCKDGGFCRVF